ncbi:MAG: aminotransferase class I/II-fold pyridoxal phosphate-dependent enzyme [Cyanobacteria bacterium SIG30]|nr:aminotransferase class I/II-fold pyridoxal phosphate-dependent enzyme [Cyanobacteria bacterium SIG30]
MNIIRKVRYKIGKLFKGSDNVPVVEALKKYKKNPCTGFHIPGHNRGNCIGADFKDLMGSEVFAVDSTDEFDNLGTLLPQSGAIEEAQKLAAEAFNSKRTFFITCGSTIGNISLALGATKPNDEIVIGRNCHRSVLTGALISGANPTWLIPKKLEDWEIFGNIDPKDLENTLKNNKDIKLVWVTNPTYEGVVSDIKEIARICKKYNVILAVDEAHGSLWNFSDKLPTSALEQGADLVVHSLHKTGGAMVQSSLLHISKTSSIDPDKIEAALKLVHTTSPSMILTASLDSARATLCSKKGQNAVNSAIENAKFFRNELKKIENVSVLDEKFGVKVDVTKIFLKIKGLSGKKLESILEKLYRIEIESAYDEGILILSNIGSTRSEFEYLLSAIKNIAQKHYKDEERTTKLMPLLDPKILMSPRDAYFSPKEYVSKEDAVNRICTEVIVFCPPGISILLPGELITKEHLPYLTNKDKIEVLKVR